MELLGAAGKEPCGDRTSRTSLPPSPASLFPSPLRLPGDARPERGGAAVPPRRWEKFAAGPGSCWVAAREPPAPPAAPFPGQVLPLAPAPLSRPHSPQKRAHAAPPAGFAAVLCLLLSRWDSLILEDFFHTRDSVILFPCAGVRHL